MEEASVKRSLLGVSFIISATITAGELTNLRETLTSLIVSLSSFWAYSISGAYTFRRYLTSLRSSSLL
jgi:hypothetical protein